MTYPLGTLLLSTVVRLVCAPDDKDRVEDCASEGLEWLRRFLPVAQRAPSAQTFRRAFPLIDPVVLERGSASDGKSVRGLKSRVCRIQRAAPPVGLCARGRLDACRPSDWRKSNEILAIAELLELLELDGAIVPIEALGPQTGIASSRACDALNLDTD